MAERNGSVVRRRVLARQLRLLREEAGLTQEEAAPRLDWSVSKLSRIETAQQAVDVHWVRSMLDLYDIGGDRWDELIELTRQTRRRGWWQAYGLGKDAFYVGYEAEATRIQTSPWVMCPACCKPPTTPWRCSAPCRYAAPRRNSPTTSPSE